MKRLILLTFLTCTPSLAQESADQTAGGMSASAFEAYVSGKTLIWSYGTQIWGIEDYLDNRRVQWSSGPGQCESGQWFEENGQICFQYDGTDGPSCWIFRQTENGLTADLQGPSGPLLLNETGQSDEGLQCPGPDVGV